MASSKYGRLYTDSDLRKVAEKLLGNHGMGPDIFAEAMAELERQGAFTFRSDEPVFPLLAHDQLALAAVCNYRKLCELQGDSDDHIRAVDEAAQEFWKWHIAHPDLMKMPD